MPRAADRAAGGDMAPELGGYRLHAQRRPVHYPPLMPTVMSGRPGCTQCAIICLSGVGPAICTARVFRVRAILCCKL